MSRHNHLQALIWRRKINGFTLPRNCESPYLCHQVGLLLHATIVDSWRVPKGFNSILLWLTESTGISLTTESLSEDEWGNISAISIMRNKWLVFTVPLVCDGGQWAIRTEKYLDRLCLLCIRLGLFLLPHEFLLIIKDMPTLNRTFF